MDPKFIEIKNALRNLLKIGMPQIFIELYFEFSTYAFSKYMRKLKKEGYKEELVPLSLGIRNIIKVFVTLPYRNTVTLDSIYEDLGRDKLKKITLDLLQVHMIDGILLMVTPYMLRMREYRFDDDVPIPYREFINMLNSYDEERNSQVELFNSHAYDLSESKSTSYKVRIKEEIPEAIAEEILKKVGDSISGDVKPRFELDVCQKLHRMLQETMTEREKIILEACFGLGQDKVTAKDISPIIGVSAARVNQIRDKAVRRCRHTSRIQFLFDPLPIALKPEKIEHVPNTEGGPHLVVDSDLPVRVLNVLLYGLEITTLEELQNFTCKEILKYKGLSKKGLCNIEDELMKYDLSLKDEYID